MKRALFLLPLLAACADPADEGRALFAEHCAACHGAAAKGGAGPDLTGLAAANGGAFPAVRVMSQIDGFSRAGAHSDMPQFGELLGGRMVLWQGPDGVATPTPAALVALADYLAGLQE